MARYDEGFKRQVVQDYLAGVGGYRALGAKYGIDEAIVRLWVAKYRQHGVGGLRRKSSHYSAQFKQERRSPGYTTDRVSIVKAS